MRGAEPMSSQRRGPPKHQNKYAWKPNAGRKINETELGGKFKPFSEITGVCPRCKDQIAWKRRYGKYKPLTEPAKCQKCSKRAVRQAHHNVCPGCAKELRICAKCCCRVDHIVGRDSAEVEAEQKMLEEAIRHSREKERRTLLRAMNKEKSKSSKNTPTLTEKDKVGDLFPNASLEEYAKLNGKNEDHYKEDAICDKKYDEEESSDDEGDGADEAWDDDDDDESDEVDDTEDKSA